MIGRLKTAAALWKREESATDAPWLAPDGCDAVAAAGWDGCGQ
jgi:hypothetical protein